MATFDTAVIKMKYIKFHYNANFLSIIIFILNCYKHYFFLLVSVKKKKVIGNVLFNDALNTFYLRLYVIRYMVKDHMGYSF